MAYKNYIDGQWIASETGETFENRNPADETDVIGEFQQSSSTDVNQAVSAAAAAQPDWAMTSGPDRGSVLREIGSKLENQLDAISRTLTREEGKTLPEARAEVQHAVQCFYYYAEKAREFQGDVYEPSAADCNLRTRREPVGVAALVSSWNYPIAIPSWKIAPALATGNAVVFKPATDAPDTMRKVFEIIESTGLPDGVANYVTGRGSDIGTRLTTHEAVDAVSFTGSTSVGRIVYDNATGDQKRIQAEMGGKNPTVVMPSADLQKAVEIVTAGAFGVTGQACTATSRALVHEGIYEAFVDEITSRAESIDVGPGLDGSEMGPQVNEDELEGTLKYIDVGESEGATLEAGGRRVSAYEDGFFVEPTVFSDVRPDMTIAQEEIFGPVLSIIRVADFDEAVEIANDVDYGLSASIVTRNHEEANQFIDRSETGLVKVNEKTTGTEVHVPFGGVKGSSSNTFREQGKSGLEFYTRLKTVYDNY